jgi:hypothetical protein
MMCSFLFSTRLPRRLRAQSTIDADECEASHPAGAISPARQNENAGAPKAGVIQCPILDLEFRLPEMMPAIRVVFVRHQKEIQSARFTDQPSTASPPPKPQISLHPCNNAERRAGAGFRATNSG